MDTLIDLPVLGGRPAGAEGLRVVLAGAHSLGALLGQRRLVPLPQLQADTNRACALGRAGRHDELGDVLAVLLPALEAAVRGGPAAQRAAACELLAMAYQSCSAALARTGQPEAAWIAADRAMAAAERAGNLVLVAAGAHRLAAVFLGAGQFALAEETARTTVTALQEVALSGDPDAIDLCGSLTLLRAVVAARASRPAAAYRQLAYARRLAARAAPGADGFGPAQVALYEVAVSVDLGDAGHALHAAAAIPAGGLLPAHQARMLVDVARAHAMRDEPGEAAAALDRAETAAPGCLADSETARQLIRDLLALQAPPAGLPALAARLGVA